jgi:hypothetical protein
VDNNNEKETVGSNAGTVIDQQTDIARRSLEIHNGYRPTQGVMGSGSDPRWEEVAKAQKVNR